MRDEAGRKIYHKLGYLTDRFGYEEARAAALKWIEGRDAGVTGESVSVAAACREYVEDRLREKGPSCALDVARLCGTSVLMIEKHYGYLVADAARDRLARVEIL